MSSLENNFARSWTAGIRRRSSCAGWRGVPWCPSAIDEQARDAALKALANIPPTQERRVLAALATIEVELDKRPRPWNTWPAPSISKTGD